MAEKKMAENFGSLLLGICIDIDIDIDIDMVCLLYNVVMHYGCFLYL